MVSKKVLIVDDEKLARDRLARFLGELNYPFEIQQANSGLSALEKIKEDMPDILFLDIQMPGLNGFELLQNLEKRPCHIIFQTAFDEYAIKAFEENASDYLLKPFTKDRLKTSVEKALGSIERQERLLALEREVSKRNGYLNRISVRVGGKLNLVEAADIQYLISQDHYTILHTTNGEFVSELSLTHLESRLDPREFLRCHRSCIVKLSQVKSLNCGTNMSVSLSEGVELPVSRTNRKTMLERLSTNSAE